VSAEGDGPPVPFTPRWLASAAPAPSPEIPAVEAAPELADGAAPEASEPPVPTAEALDATAESQILPGSATSEDR
jgi:hypothetical protein